jgi:ATP-binding cassette subfamily B protein
MSGLWFHLKRKRKVQAGFLIILTVFSALSEVISLGAIIPFIAVITAPETVFRYEIIVEIAGYFDIISPEDLVLPITILFCCAALTAGLIRGLLLWLSTKLAFSAGSDLSIEVYRKTLYQPYSVHVTRNTSEVISGIISKLNGVITWVLFPILAMINSFFLLIAIITTLLYINPIIAIISIGIIGLCYFFITILSKNRLLENANREAKEQTQSVKALQEGLGGIRDVLLSRSQPIYCEVYSNSDKPLRAAQGNNVFIGQSPRFAMEVLGMIIIALVAYNLSKSFDGSSLAPLQVLGVLAFAAQRLMPALQQIYTGWSAITGHKTAINDVLDLLDQPFENNRNRSAEFPLVFNKSLELKEVCFKYNNKTQWIVEDLNLSVPKGSRVGLVGSTGSGKSTTLDLIMGLLEPTQGSITVDGVKVDAESLLSWQLNISHVPQNIFLADGTFAENIALGLMPEDIDMDLVKQSAKLAKIDKFIESKLNNYHESVGERGVLLSGGERQRIGIARALYRKAPVLVLDEATSSLDNTTEQYVMDSISSLDSNLTIFLIAHRLTTVKNCDIIIEMQDGRIVATGTYKELLDGSESFRKMAEILTYN